MRMEIEALLSGSVFSQANLAATRLYGDENCVACVRPYGLQSK
jgi:hypothetical protein